MARGPDPFDALLVAAGRGPNSAAAVRRAASRGRQAWNLILDEDFDGHRL